MAPCTKTSSPPHTLPIDKRSPRAIYELLRSKYATDPVAPSLHDISGRFYKHNKCEIRLLKVTWKKYLPWHDTTKVFDYFIFLHFLLHPPIPEPGKEAEYFEGVSFHKVASTLVALHDMSPSQARHAYAGLIHIPPFTINFFPILAHIKSCGIIPTIGMPPFGMQGPSWST